MTTLRRTFLVVVFLTFWVGIPCFCDKYGDMELCGKLADAGQFAQAIFICDQAVKRLPRQGLVYHWRGIAYRGVGRLDDANQDGETALKHFDRIFGPEWEQKIKQSLSLSYQFHGDKYWQ
jgi:tetratricopeptide (TPR) repeat protein